GGEAVAGAAGASLGLGLHPLRAADIPAAPADRHSLATLWDREAVLSGSALLIDSHAAEPDTLRAVTAFVESLEGPAFLAAREPLRPFRRPAVRLDVARPTAAEQLSLWQSALGPHSEPLNGQLRELVTHFRLSWPGIRAASPAAPPPGSPDAARALWNACRTQARPRLDDLAQRIESAAGGDDLVLPAGQRQT